MRSLSSRSLEPRTPKRRIDRLRGLGGSRRVVPAADRAIAPEDRVAGLGHARLLGVGSATSSGSILEVLCFAFQTTFAIITPAPIVGAFAERVKCSASETSRAASPSCFMRSPGIATRALTTDGPIEPGPIHRNGATR